MSKVKYILSFLTVSLFLLVSCAKEEEAKIDVSSTSLDVTSGAAKFTVTSNVKWTLSQSGEFNFTVSPTSGEAGTTEVSVSAYSANNADKARTSTITITGGSATAAVSVSQSPVIFTLSTDELLMEAQESTKSITVTSNTEWNVNGITIPNWIKSITPTATSGNGEIKITVNENTSRLSENTFLLRISYGGSLSKSVEIRQDAAYNNPPTKPAGLKPEDNATDVSMMPFFSWEASSDVEGDEITYYVHLSTDGKSWKRISAGKSTSVPLPSTMGVLQNNTRYYYKVSADDGHNEGVTESDVQTFTVSSEKDAYADGDYMVYMESSKPNPVVFVFTGDGYLAEHYKYGGNFDQDVNEAIDALFNMEPYKSYKEYFTVYKIAAYSNQTGITNKSTNEIRDTKFKLEWEGGRSTGINCNDDIVFEWVQKIPEVTGEVLRKGAIGVISNADVYAGTCISYSDGMSISMIPYLRGSTSQTTTFANVIVHEMGGHGFGRLGDEYKNYNEKAPQDRIDAILSFQNDWSCPFYMNLSVYPQQSKSLWAHFAGLEGYSHVGMFEGGGLYTQGVWRPEQISCMEDNRMYYNSPSRFYIVKRLLEAAGELEPYSDDDTEEVRAQKIAAAMARFLERDVQRTDNTQSNTKGWEGVPYDFIPLGPTRFVVVEE